eukprot:c43736_g1_i1 orf=1-150(-)
MIVDTSTALIHTHIHTQQKRSCYHSLEYPRLSIVFLDVLQPKETYTHTHT